MRLFIGLCSVLAWQFACFAQVSVRGIPAVQDAFGGKENEVVVAISNTSAEGATAELSYTLFQLSSSTAAPIGTPTEWKTVKLRPGQTVLERLRLTLPEVKAAAGFRVQVLDSDQKPLGTAVVRALPDKPLGSINALAGGATVGVISSSEEFKDALRELGLNFESIAREAVGSFAGPLMIFDAYQTTTAEAAEVRRAAESAKANVIIMLKAPADQTDRLKSTRERQFTKVELSLQPENAPTKSASFAWRLLEAAKTCLEVRP